MGSVPHVGDISGFLITVPAVLGDLGETAVHPFSRCSRRKRFVSCKQMAGKICRVLPFAFQRTSVGSAGGYFPLNNTSVFTERNRFDAALPAEIGPVRMPVIENIPFSPDFHDTAMIIPAIAHRLFSRLIGIHMTVIVADNHAPIHKILHRRLTGGIAQLNHGN